MPLYRKAGRSEAYKVLPSRTMTSSAQELVLTKEEVNFRRLPIAIGSPGHNDPGPFIIRLPIPQYIPGSAPDTDLDGRIINITFQVYSTASNVLPRIWVLGTPIPGPGPGGFIDKQIFQVGPINNSVGGDSLDVWFGCNVLTWRLIDSPIKEGSPPTSCEYEQTIESIFPGSTSWEFNWNTFYGKIGSVQLFAIPLTYNSPGNYTDPGYTINKTYLTPPGGFVDNPAHPITIPNFSFSLINKPFFVNDWGLSSSGSAVNFPGYPQVATACVAPESRVRLGALSGQSNSFGVLSIAYFTVLQAVSFRLGIVVDSIADPAYTPDYVVVAGKEDIVGQELQGYSKGKSTLITKNGKPKILRYGVRANAGDHFSIQLLSNTPSRVMAMSMLMFDSY